MTNRTLKNRITLGGVIGVVAALFAVPSFLVDFGQLFDGNDKPGICSQAQHPKWNTLERRTILDSLRRHYAVANKYVVKKMVVLGEWAYIEAHPETESQDRAYLARYDNSESQWSWRWDGETNAQKEGEGNPPYPPDFHGRAREVLTC
jgi:hypothetical protein